MVLYVGIDFQDIVFNVSAQFLGDGNHFIQGLPPGISGVETFMAPNGLVVMGQIFWDLEPLREQFLGYRFLFLA